MSSTLAAVRDLVAASDVLISAHGYDQLADDDILISDVLEGVAGAQVVETTPNIIRVPASSYCSATALDARSMWSGAFHAERNGQLYW